MMKKTNAKEGNKNAGRHFLEVYRFDNHLTLEQLAKKLGCSAAALSKIENGDTVIPSLRLRQKIKRLTGIDPGGI